MKRSFASIDDCITESTSTTLENDNPGDDDTGDELIFNIQDEFNCSQLSATSVVSSNSNTSAKSTSVISSSSEASPCFKNKAKRRQMKNRSRVWIHFERIDGNNKIVKCLHFLNVCGCRFWLPRGRQK